MIETTPLYGAKWQQRASVMLQLSRGWLMRNLVLVRRDEIARVLPGARSASGRLGPEVFTFETDGLFATPAPEPSLPGCLASLTGFSRS